MSKLNDFRLSYETALLFVISYEYRIPFAKLLGMYNISDKIFWAYLSLFSNMSKMGVRKGSQLSKMANRIFKYTRGIKDKIYNKIYVDVVDEDGNLVYDDKGNILKDKQIKVTMTPVELDENELKIQKVLKLYATKGYSNGEVFYSNDDIKGTHIRTIPNGLNIDGEIFSECTEIEHMIERYFPEMTVAEYRSLSVREMGDMLSEVIETEKALNETKS